jgi:hypothetical protein
MVFKPAEDAAKTVSQSETQPVTDQLQSARSAHKSSCEELFRLCYQIQATGEFPDPTPLAQAILQYRATRALLEECSAGPRADASPKSGSLKGLLEQLRIP